MKYFLIFATAIFFSVPVLAQQDSVYIIPVGPEEVVYCNPQLEGQGPSKGAQLTYGRLWNTRIKSKSFNPEIGSVTDTIQRTNFLNFKFKVPVWNRPSFKILLGFEYEYQEFIFGESEPLFDLYQNLQQKHLKTIGGSITTFKAIDEFRYVVLNVDADLNGDYTKEQLPTLDFLKVSISGLYGIKTCPTKTYGVGLYYNYTFGRQRLLPALLYNQTFNKNWGIELLLPAEAKLRYNLDRSTLFYFGAEVSGASYNLIFDDPPLTNYPNLQLRKSSLRGVLEFNREIYDFIWFGISGGIDLPISFNLVEQDDRGFHIRFNRGIQIVRGDPLVRSNLSVSPYAQISLFLVPPRKLVNKILNTR